MFSFCLRFVSVIAYSSHSVEYTISFNDFIFDFIPLALLYKMFSLLFVVCFYVIAYWWKSVVKHCVIDYRIICLVDFFCKICFIWISEFVAGLFYLVCWYIFMSVLNIKMYCIFLFHRIGIFACLTSVLWKYTVIKFYDVKMSMVNLKFSPNVHFRTFTLCYLLNFIYCCL